MTLNIGIGFSLSPYIFQGEKRGAEFELVAAVLEDAGYRMRSRFVSMNRRVHEFDRQQLDGILTVTRPVVANACLTRPYIHYQNVVASLAEQDIELGGINDMRGYSIAAFQTAHKVISPEFARMAEEHDAYMALPNQLNQVQMLYRKRVDLVVSDINIFRWYALILGNENKIDPTMPIRVHPLFQPSPKMASFWDPEVCRAFDLSYGKLLAEGEVARIFQRYGLSDSIIENAVDIQFGS
ncbi:substrate-binding periplasmic protein [Aestuariispira insulae]|uniref:substrate-binding periplasmic protein n=1 Tax=Aestuariispira insulae TaxID=1461337 RepID=UPI0015F29DF5|nr:transporter substrate-binding domain-containing protein [Aestuariispira insulae]